MHTEEGRLYLSVAIDRTSKFAVAELHERATRRVAADFLRALATAVPNAIHMVLTDNGFQVVDPTPLSKADAAPAHDDAPALARARLRARVRAAPDRAPPHEARSPVDQRQVERMNRTIKDATVHRYYYDTHAQLGAHLALFLNAYNYARPLKALRGLTPYEFVRRR